MKKNKLLFHLIIISFLFLGFYFVLKNTNFKNHPNSLNVQIISLQEETKLYKINVEYPTFPEFEKLNLEIKTQVDNKIAEFKKNVATNWSDRKKNALPDEKLGEFPESPWPMKISWVGDQLNNNNISFILRFDSFQGGASGMQELKTFNYDSKNNKDIKLAELFPNNPDYLKTISDFAKTDLTSQFQNDTSFPLDFIDTGTKPALENFQNFTVSNDSLTFYFPKYQVAPGAYGEEKVVMPRNMTK